MAVEIKTLMPLCKGLPKLKGTRCAWQTANTRSAVIL